VKLDQPGEAFDEDTGFSGARAGYYADVLVGAFYGGALGGRESH
jgi:hypothetical protein